MSYITKDQVKTFLSISWNTENTLIDQLITMGEEYLNSLLWIKGLETNSYTEEVAYHWEWPYILHNINITSINEVSWKVLNSNDYKIKGRMVYFNFSPDIQYFWYNSYVEIKYTAWFDEIPADIQSAMLIIVAWLYNKRKWIGIKSYSQWDFNLQYNTQIEYSQFTETKETIIKRYKLNRIIKV